MKKEFLLIAVLSLGLSACGLFERHPDSGYEDGEMASISGADNYFKEKKTYELHQTKRELGLSSGRPLSERETHALTARLYLNRLEKNLNSSAERKQYYSYKPYMRNDAERVQFLRLPSLEARERWASNRGYTGEPSTYPIQVRRLIEDADITTGMTRKAVVESWGDPDVVEVAGSKLYGNERWKYNRTISSENGFNSETHIVYFEAGRVVGWDKN